MKADENLITWLLQESGITPHTIAKQLGINKQTIYNLSNGDSKMENITFATAAALTDYAELKMKEENKMKTWNRNGYSVEERDFDYDLHKFVIVVDDEDVAEIVPGSIEDMQEVISQLDAGEDAVGWENGNGETVELPEYTIETEDPEVIARGGHNKTELYRTYSRKEAEEEFKKISFDKGLTLILSKWNPDRSIDCLDERTE